MAVTVKDIAEAAGVSITTVSLVLSGRKCRVSQKTREKVLRIARELDYQPNHLARSLVTRKSHTIGLIIPDISNHFFSELAKGVEMEAQSSGYNIIFSNSNEDGAKDIKNVRLLINKSVDGLIIVPSIKESNKKTILELKQIVSRHKLPLITVDRLLPEMECSYVLLDNREGGYIATKHLLEYGHRKIGCITGPQHHVSSDMRYRGYWDALMEFGIPIDENLVYHGDYRLHSGVEGAKSLIHKNVTAIFACNDMMAIGAYRQACIMNKKIGTELSLVGFDDIPFAEMLEYPLTTIHQPIYDIGKNSCRMLLDIINGNTTSIHKVKYAPTLVTRATTRAPNLDLLNKKLS